MKDNIINIQIENIDSSKVDQAANIFVSAFKNEAFTSAWLNLSNKQIKNAFLNLVKNRLLLDIKRAQPAICAIIDGKIVGLMIVSNSSYKISEGLYLAQKCSGSILRLLPKAIIGLLKGIPALMAPPESLSKNVLFLEILATKPELQGKGIGKMLLNKAKQLYFDNKDICAIYLFTGDEKNYHYYLKQGFKLVKTRKSKNLTAWHFTFSSQP